VAQVASVFLGSSHLAASDILHVSDLLEVCRIYTGMIPARMVGHQVWVYWDALQLK
jgi:hypothetical protein